MATSKIQIPRVVGQAAIAKTQTQAAYEEVGNIAIPGGKTGMLSVVARYWDIRPIGLKITYTASEGATEYDVDIVETTNSYPSLQLCVAVFAGIYHIYIKTGAEASNVSKAFGYSLIMI